MPLKRILLHSVIWLALYLIWVMGTRQFHPSEELEWTVTAVLVGASAAAVYINHLVLRPRFRGKGRRWSYVLALLGTIFLIDLVAVELIEFIYDQLWGPDSLRFGFWFNMLSDGIIIIAHVAGAMAVGWTVRLLSARR